MVEEIIGRLPYLTESQLGRLEDKLRRERQRRASSEGGGEGAPQIHEGTTPPVTEVLEYRPHEDGYLQLELRRYIRRDGSTRERGPYRYFQFHEGGKRKKLYLGKTSDPERTLATKRAAPSRHPCFQRLRIESSYGAMALTFLVKWRLWGGVLKARYFSTVWRCIPRVLAICAFFVPFFERVWMER
jgi:hypothetical protein